jgi:ABC-type antimicrobial peptide transport system permease subunit
MSLTVTYNFRHLLHRRTTTALTVLGIALVVFVFVSTMMLSEGVKATLAATGSPENIIVIRNGARNEIQSGVERGDTNTVLTDADIDRLPDGTPLATKDTVVLISLKKRADGQPSNVTIRGVSPFAYQIRDAVKLTSGRLPSPGTREVIVGSAIRRKFQGTGIGESLRLAGSDWTVVGLFDAGNTGFSSEIWGDTEILLPSFRRERFSSITFRLRHGADAAAVKSRLEGDKRLTVTVMREIDFYAEQSRELAKFIQAIGGVVSVIFSLGAVIGASITMYAAVSNRVREIGILRALGFGRLTIFASFTKECLLIAFIGGVLGILFSSFMSFVAFSTTNFSTFSEVAFQFRLTAGIATKGLLFALGMGLLGGALPAWSASRLRLLDALRE